MCSSLFKFAPVSRGSFQAEKRITVLQPEQIKKMRIKIVLDEQN
jgi:hypothetical protein